jgi:hypothetical protein
MYRRPGEPIARALGRTVVICTATAAINLEMLMSDLTNSNPTPPDDVKAELEKNAEESKKLDSPLRTNDSTIDPNKPAKDVLKGFHGG